MADPTDPTDSTGPWVTALPPVPQSVRRGFSGGGRAFFLAVGATVALAELASATGVAEASVPIAPFLLVFWVYSLHAGLGGYAGAPPDPITVTFAGVLAVTLVAVGYLTVRDGNAGTVVPAVAGGASLAVGYLPFLVCSHLVVAATVPSVALLDPVFLRLFVDVGVLYPVTFGGLGGFLYAWRSLPIGVEDV